MTGRDTVTRVEVIKDLENGFYYIKYIGYEHVKEKGSWHKVPIPEEMYKKFMEYLELSRWAVDAE